MLSNYLSSNDVGRCYCNPMMSFSPPSSLISFISKSTSASKAHLLHHSTQPLKTHLLTGLGQEIWDMDFAFGI